MEGPDLAWRLLVAVELEASLGGSGSGANGAPQPDSSSPPSICASAWMLIGAHESARRGRRLGRRLICHQADDRTSLSVWASS